MYRSRFPHILTAVILLLSSIGGFTSCIYEYPEECSEDGPAGWYPTKVDAAYDTEWYIPITPRQASYKDSTSIFGIAQSQLQPRVPDGLRIISYPDDGGDMRSFNLPAHGGEINLRSLSSHLLFYNNDTEYIIIDPQAGFDKTIATTRRHSPETYQGNSAIGTDISTQPVYSEPDMLYTASMADYNADAADSARVINVLLDPAVYTYVIHFMFKDGLDYVSAARGAISGMASGVYLSSGNTVNDNGITILYNCERQNDGLTGAVKSFGVPGYIADLEQIEPTRRYGITLQAYLKNGRLLSFDFDVTSQVAVQPLGGIIMVDGISIPDSIGKPSGGSGGFNVDVSPWGPSSDIDIDF
ncbi:MAG: DUF5119 domain-containing protein [Duncaniella sp.]|nr:DUF5119 domain-containing protein [Duncaniella sp.]